MSAFAPERTHDALARLVLTLQNFRSYNCWIVAISFICKPLDTLLDILRPPKLPVAFSKMVPHCLDVCFPAVPSDKTKANLKRRSHQSQSEQVIAQLMKDDLTVGSTGKKFVPAFRDLMVGCYINKLDTDRIEERLYFERDDCRRTYMQCKQIDFRAWNRRFGGVNLRFLCRTEIDLKGLDDPISFPLQKRLYNILEVIH